MSDTGDQARPGEALEAEGRRTRRKRRIWVTAGVLVVLIALYLTASLLTDQTSFCGTACHEMKPYYEAYLVGQHHGRAQCINCHVDPGLLARIVHKPYAVKELWSHITGNTGFPKRTERVPNLRCTSCHSKIPDKVDNLTFSHSEHVEAVEGSCMDCHATTGHNVTAEALRANGTLAPGASAVTTIVVIPEGMQGSAIPGHRKVVCQVCHDQKAMECKACHLPPIPTLPGVSQSPTASPEATTPTP